jgi:hypothetical protein
MRHRTLYRACERLHTRVIRKTKGWRIIFRPYCQIKIGKLFADKVASFNSSLQKEIGKL